MPPRKKRAVQTEEKDESPTVSNGTKASPEAVGSGQEEQEAMVQVGNGSALPVTESPDLLTAARLEELEKAVRRRTYVVHPEGKTNFNRRETYFVSFNPVLEEESASEDVAPETGPFFVGHASDLQEAATATAAVDQEETNVMEQKPRGRKKKEKNTANPEGNDLASEIPKKRGRKKKMVSVDQTTENIPVGLPNNDEPALVDNNKDDYFAAKKKSSKPKSKDIEALSPKKPAKRGRKKKNELLAEQPTENMTEDSSNIDNPVVIQSIESSDTADNLLHQTDNGKESFMPTSKVIEALSPKKPAKRGRKKNNELLAELPTENITEDSSNIDNPVVIQSMESSDSADYLLHQTDNGKTLQLLEEDTGKSQDNPKKKPVKRRKN